MPLRLLQGPHEVIVVLLWIQHLRFEATVLVMLLEGLYWVFVDENAFPAPQWLAFSRSKSCELRCTR